jgi:hypothetical protein
MLKLIANFFGWVGTLILIACAISALAALLPFAAIGIYGLLLCLPALFLSEKKTDGEENNE